MPNFITFLSPGNNLISRCLGYNQRYLGFRVKLSILIALPEIKDILALP